MADVTSADLIHAAILFLPLATVAVIVSIAAGWLRPGALSHAPKRRVGLTLFDIAVGLVIFILGVILASLLAQWLGVSIHAPSPPPPAPPASTLALGATAPAAVTVSGFFSRLCPTGRHAIVALLSQLLTQLPVVIYFIARVIRTPRGLTKAGVLPRHPLRDVGAGLLALLIVFPILTAATLITVAISLYFHHASPEVGHVMLRAMEDSHCPWATNLLIASAVIIAPILEETIFRGLIQTSLLPHARSLGGRWGVVLLGALIFAGVHTGAAAWQTLPALLILGITLGWLYERRGSLLPGIILHMTFNALEITLAMHK